VLTALARVPGGILSDKVGGELALVLAFSMVFLGSVMMIFAQDIPWALAGAVMMALGMGVANAGVFKLVPKYNTCPRP